MKTNIIMKTVFCLFLLLLQITTFAQQKEYEQMLDNSRPGSHHALLSKLVGNWNFQDTKLAFVKGTLVRKPVYDGRFYSVEITGGKLQLPIADGKMKEDNYKGFQLEGYDNVRGKFFTTSINNHIGSDIQMETGSYDTVKKEFTYTWESELIKGKPEQNLRIIKMIDDTHYIETYFERQNGAYVKIRELDYSKAMD